MSLILPVCCFRLSSDCYTSERRYFYLWWRLHRRVQGRPVPLPLGILIRQRLRASYQQQGIPYGGEAQPLCIIYIIVCRNFLHIQEKKYLHRSRYIQILRLLSQPLLRLQRKKKHIFHLSSTQQLPFPMEN